ncbi:Calumenin-A [Dirofilaria immitis]|nr:Calumenin-A [Dirofilaria immitis]
MYGLHLVRFCIARAEQVDPLTDKDHFKAGGHDSKFDHEAFLGKDTAESKDVVSKERLAKLVAKMDVNGDGFLEETELKDHIDFMQKRYVNNDVDRTWKNYNAEKIKDGKISWKDYVWKKADYDLDEMMDRTEYGCFMHPEDCDHMRDVVVQETLEDIDKNKDGYVDLDEYIGDMYRPEDYPELNGKEPEWVASEREMFKEHRDKNGDGKLDQDEMRDWIMPIGFDHADAEAKHLIGIADEDRDGKLSLKEILDHYDTFVGSQATDYGEQLNKHDPAEL